MFYAGGVSRQPGDSKINHKKNSEKVASSSRAPRRWQRGEPRRGLGDACSGAGAGPRPERLFMVARPVRAKLQQTWWALGKAVAPWPVGGSRGRRRPRRGSGRRATGAPLGCHICRRQRSLGPCAYHERGTVQSSDWEREEGKEPRQRQARWRSVRTDPSPVLSACLPPAVQNSAAPAAVSCTHCKGPRKREWFILAANKGARFLFFLNFFLRITFYRYVWAIQGNSNYFQRKYF